MTINYTIKIPDQCYVGFSIRSDSSVPLGFMTPYETHSTTGEPLATCKKRMDQVDYWSGARYGKTNTGLQPTIVDNKPMIGFRISRSLRRLGYGSQNTYIRIEDPRGFELEITVSNLIMLTDNNLIENGEILRECVWGRDGNENVLLPINSEPYLQATANTERQKSAVSSRQVKPGDTVLLKNGLQGIYMGLLYQTSMASTTGGYKTPRCNQVFTRDKKVHYVRVVDANGKVAYNGYASLQASSVVEENPKTKNEINEMLLKDFMTGVSTSQPGYHYPFLLTTHIPKIKSLGLEETTLEAMYEKKNAYQRHNIPFMLVRKKDDDQSQLIQCGIENMNRSTGPRSKYIYGFGYVGDDRLYGAKATIDTTNGSITTGQSDSDYSSYDPSEAAIFRLAIEFEIAELNQTLKFV